MISLYYICQSGKLYKSTGNACSENSTEAYSVPYEECLGCNRFEDLGNSEDNKKHLPAWQIALIVVGSISVCALCCGLGVLCIYGSASFVAFVCCDRKQATTDQRLLHQQQYPVATASPVCPHH